MGTEISDFFLLKTNENGTENQLAPSLVFTSTLLFSSSIKEINKTEKCHNKNLFQ